MAIVYKIKDFLKRIKNSIEIEDGVLYKRVTVSGNHKGVSLRDIEDGFKIGTKKQFTISAGDFILSKIDARNGAFGIIPDDLDGAIITGNFWTYKVDNELVNSDWFFYFTHSFNFIQLCIESSTGSTHRKYLNEQIFLNQNIFLPKIAEQVAMVEKYKQQSKISANLKREIFLQKQLVSKLKQSILQDAIQGELTKDWRKENPTIEPASELLKRIKAEKAQLVKEKKIKKEKPLPAITKDEIPFELPEGWIWCRLGEIITLKSGQDLTKSEYNDNAKGIPYLTGASHIYNNKINVSRWTDSPKSVSRLGDLLLTCKGTIGKMVFNTIGDIHIARQVMAIETFYNTEKLFIKYFLENFTEELIMNAKSLIPGISRDDILHILFPLPPFEEQKALVEKVETLLQKCTALEQEIAKSEANAEMLMQAVLKEAFEKKGEKEVEELEEVEYNYENK